LVGLEFRRYTPQLRRPDKILPGENPAGEEAEDDEDYRAPLIMPLVG